MANHHHAAAFQIVWLLSLPTKMFLTDLCSHEKKIDAEEEEEI